MKTVLSIWPNSPAAKMAPQAKAVGDDLQVIGPTAIAHQIGAAQKPISISDSVYRRASGVGRMVLM